MSEVRLNIYDLHPINPHIRFLGLGFYHTGVEVMGWEYTFATAPDGTSAIVKVEPRVSHPGFRESLLLGKCKSWSVENAIRKLES